MKYPYLHLFCIVLWGCGNPESKREIDYTDNTPQTDETSGGAYLQKKIQENPVFEPPANVLPMEVQNGVRYVWIEINGIRLKFIFDTGASSICISPAEANVLYRQGLLQEEDIIGSQSFQDATGKISEGTKINLREVKIGNMILEDIEATVIDNINAPLLLGQSVLERFGRIEIDNESNEIIFR